MNVDFPIEKLGHDYERQEDTRPATCEKPEYIVELCINEVNRKSPRQLRGPGAPDRSGEQHTSGP